MRNSAFFLTPKLELICLERSATIRQSTERIENHRFFEMIILDKEGHYLGVLSAKELLLAYKNTEGLTFETASNFKIKDIDYNEGLLTAHIDTKADLLVELAIKQNIIPIVDSNNIFIGIVRRADLLEYYYKKREKEKDE